MRGLYGNSGGKKSPDFGASQNILMLLLWVVIVLSTLKVAWMTYTIETFIDWGIFVVIYFLVVDLVDGGREFSACVWTIVLGMSTTAFIGILQNYGIDFTGMGIGWHGIRGVGIFDMNQLAHGCAFAAALAIGLLISAESTFAKICVILLLCILYYAIFLTRSRGGVISGLLVLAVSTFLYQRNRSGKILALAVGVVAFIAAMVVMPRLKTIDEFQTESSAKGRLDVWGEALVELKENPILGVGKGQFREYFEIAPHNSYIQVGTEIGLVGLFLWIGMFYYSFKALRGALRKSNIIEQKEKWLRAFPQSFLAAAIAYCMSSTVSGSGSRVFFYIFFALVAALQKMLTAGFKKKKVTFVRKDLLRILVSEVAIIAIIKGASVCVMNKALSSRWKALFVVTCR